MSVELFVTDEENVVDERVNRNYKDSVFRMLFRDRSALLSLYSKRAIKIPFPQFITFYNGVEE